LNSGVRNLIGSSVHKKAFLHARSKKTENAANNCQKCYQMVKIVTILHKIKPLTETLIAYFGPKVDMPSLLRMRKEKWS